MSILDKLVSMNEAPIFFIGSGMSQRYVPSYPTWENLLKELWRSLGFEVASYFQESLRIRNSLSSEQRARADYYTNIKMASTIETKMAEMFLNGSYTIDGFSWEDAYRLNTSPLKADIARYFSRDACKPVDSAEIKQYKQMLRSARAIFTTNFDCLIETLLEAEDYTVFVRQSDLFMANENYGELYKIHGCVSSPNDIVITEDDYDRYQERSVLISAKLMSMMMTSPLIFFGYSLNDYNIAQIFQKFSSCLSPKQRDELSERIIYINWRSGITGLEERKMEMSALGGYCTVIETDNYGEIYDKLSKIKQGLPVSIVRQHLSQIHRLVIERGRRGSLKTLIVSPVELGSGSVDDDSLVIAIGNDKVIFNFPTRYDYMIDYFKEAPETPPLVALRYAASQPSSTYLPIKKHMERTDLENSSLRGEEIEKIRQRIANHTSERCVSTILPTYQIKHESVLSVVESNTNKRNQLAVLCYNAPTLNSKEIRMYLIDLLASITMSEFKGGLGTWICKIAVIIDNKDD